MNIIFMGTSDFAVPSLLKLIESPDEILTVVTQPDRPRGRGNKFVPSPVKEVALKYELPLFQPARIKIEESVDRIQSLEADIIVVASYGQIIPPELLDYPRLGCINVHASLLPRYRGAAPIQRAIMAGEEISGVTTMAMDSGLDTGDIILQMPVPIPPEMDHGQYEQLLAVAGADLLMDTLAILKSGSFPRKKQNPFLASYAHMLTREEEEINWQDEAISIHNRIRALSPKPAAYTSFQGKRFKIFKSRTLPDDAPGEPGEIVAIVTDGFIVKSSRGLLEIREVQMEGRKRMPSGDFLKGFKLKVGDILGN
ncbi:Methionyl-tRNA formyltransferase [Syntrophomonas zehnderi OL-4]|uniref:Methionyl-tRNA formyltransferase n=1 Tax=Syntrophomonas zehnderi OL-4 TaxID=690567 RepID=A0A0E4GE71_9FIRM|nr:methionyl-tRNA formyltransferase [Syntrophomonas zehnderi]CFX77230.1 Methionyl-tRNA formyltransferase [Syntrophomonas zehnderi OL-4]